MVAGRGRDRAAGGPGRLRRRQTTAWIDYDGPPGTTKTVSFSRVVQGKTPRGLFRDKVVVVGPSAPSLQDVHPTSTTGNELMSGAEIQANAIETVRRGLPLERAPGGLNVALDRPARARRPAGQPPPVARCGR